MRLADGTQARWRGHIVGQARAESVAPTDVLTRLAARRLLWRLGATPLHKHYVLRGGWVLWTHLPAQARVTYGIDLLALPPPAAAPTRPAEARAPAAISRAQALAGAPGPAVPDLLAEAPLRAMVSELSAVPAADGLRYGPERLACAAGRTPAGLRHVTLALPVRLAELRASVAICVTQGDALTPGPERLVLPETWDLPGAALLAENLETILAEKLQTAMALRGEPLNRWQDWYDMAIVAGHARLDGNRLIAAVRATCARRITTLAEAPPLPGQGVGATLDEAAWQRFLRGCRGAGPRPDLPTVCEQLAALWAPVFVRLHRGHGFAQVWENGGPWR